MLDQLPTELLSLTFEFLETNELFPRCFLTCKAFLNAILDDYAWKERCARDLSLVEPTSPSWLQTYKENLLVWDPEHATLGVTEREALSQRLYGERKQGSSVASSVIHSGENKNFFFNKNVVLWNGPFGYVSARTKRCYAAGSHKIAFEVVGFKGSHIFGLGLVDENWDCRLHAFATDTNRSWCWCRQRGCSHAVTGMDADSRERPGKSALPGWEVGDILVFWIQFESNNKKDPFARTIRLYKNGQWCETIAMPQDLKKLWPVASLYGAGDSLKVYPFFGELPEGKPPSSA
ncbi:hypothetical protein QOT17_004261 [Balamuthia mandrillaris]